MRVIEKAYAKINLVLNVTNKRSDGYHEVDFLMDSVNIYDKIELSTAKEDEVVCPKAPFIKKETNLAYLAYQLMKKEFNLQDNMRIYIHKVIPVSAGMAGGSSDAAAVIRGINRMYRLNLSLEEMAELGAKLGSDVPFCIYSSLARSKGRGEKITLIDKKLPKTYVVIINPGVGLSTPKVYKNHIIENTQQDIEQTLASENFAAYINKLHNDLEKTAMRIEPRIEKMINYINEKYENRIMVSGSGPTILVFSKTKEERDAIFKYSKKKYNNVFYTTTRG